MPVALVCEGCSEVFERPPSNVRPYCSKKCFDVVRAFSPEKFWARVDKRGPDDCWPWTGGHDGSDGYGRAYDGKRTRQAHDIAWELSTGKKLRRGRLVRHTCDNRPCCNPRHLLEGAPLDNVRDSIERGRKRTPYIDFPVPLHRRPRGRRNGMYTHPESRMRGTRNGNAKATRRMITRIRVLRRTKRLTYAVLSKRFGISISQLHRITTDKSWQWLKGGNRARVH